MRYHARETLSFVIHSAKETLFISGPGPIHKMKSTIAVVGFIGAIFAIGLKGLAMISRSAGSAAASHSYPGE